MKQTPFMVGPNFGQLNRLLANDEFELHDMIRHTLRLLRPQRVRGFEKKRFGGFSDGGYVHLDDFDGIDTAISMGINDNIVWDVDVADRGLTVQQFDHTVDDPAPDDSRMVFHKKMIAPHPGPDAETLEDIVARFDLGRDRPNMILKMDIENWEWPVFDATSLDAVSRFSQIVCEMHNFEALPDLHFRQTCFRVLRKLSKFYAPIHIHANNYAAYRQIAGVPVACVIEVTFANRALYKIEESEELFPGSLDAPCAPERPDLYLGNFRY